MLSNRIRAVVLTFYLQSVFAIVFLIRSKIPVEAGSSSMWVAPFCLAVAVLFGPNSVAVQFSGVAED